MKGQTVNIKENWKDVDYANKIMNELFGVTDCISYDMIEDEYNNQTEEDECDGCEFFVGGDCQLFDNDGCKPEEEDRIDNECEDDEYEKLVLDYEFYTVFDCCGVMFVRLENGDILAAHSYCPNPDYYDEKTSLNICFDKIKSKLEELAENGYLF